RVAYESTQGPTTACRQRGRTDPDPRAGRRHGRPRCRWCARREGGVDLCLGSRVNLQGVGGDEVGRGQRDAAQSVFRSRRAYLASRPRRTLREFFERELVADEERWNELYRPLLGMLAVARHKE